MRYHQIIEKRTENGTTTPRYHAGNGSLTNAYVKMAQGYVNGMMPGFDTCYAYAGSKLAEIDPPEAEIRFWGMKNSGLIVHGDALLPDGKVLSDIPPEKYAPSGYELVQTVPFDEFKNWVDASLKLSHSA